MSFFRVKIVRIEIFGQVKILWLLGKIFYNNPICPYVFMNTKLENLFLTEISNSLSFKNRVEFVQINKTRGVFFNIKCLFYLNLNFYSEKLTTNNLDTFVFKKIKQPLIQGNLESIDENLFENFNQIIYISIKSDSLINFFHRGTKWINSLNKNLNVNLEDKKNLENHIKKLVSVKFAVQNWLLFNEYYKFPDEDICLFKDFPHSQLVMPLIVFYPIRVSKYEKCSCTLYWLIQNYKYYTFSGFKFLRKEVFMASESEDYFFNLTVNRCIRRPMLNNNGTIHSCNFSRLFENCNHTTFKTSSFNGIQNFIILKWFRNVTEVYIRTILCSFGLITNIFTLKVIRIKKNSKNFNNPMYKHIGFNALFNILFCLIYLFSLMNICIYPNNSFCSSIWRTEFSQYFHIYVILFFGNSLRLCCNISNVFFSISRFALSGTSNENKLRKFMEKQKIKRFYII